MKYLAILAVLFLASCTVNSSDPDALRAEAAQIERATARAYAGTQAAQVEQDRQEKAARMATQGAAEIEIQAMNAQAGATVSAITNQQAALDLALDAQQATQRAWGDNLRMTQTQAPIEATQTVRPTVIAAAQRIATNKADFSDVFPLLGNLIFLILAVLAIILTVWAGARGAADVKKKNQEHKVREYKDRFYAARDGTYFLPEGEKLPVQVSTLSRMWLLPSGNGNGHEESLEDIPEESEDELDQQGITAFNLRDKAIQMIDAAIEANGNTEQLPGWRLIPGWNSVPWQTIVNYLVQVNLIRQGDNRKYFVVSGKLSDARYKLEATSPTPNGSVN